MMDSSIRTLIKAVAWVGAAMVIIVVFHLGGTIALHVGQFAPLTGAFIGGSLTLFSATYARHRHDTSEPWVGLEQVSWILIGFGIILWGIGESFWRYYVSQNQAPFPSIADIGYSSFPVFVFTGLLLQPAADAQGKRLVLIMDSLISMGSIFALAWYLLLGSLAQAAGEANLAKFLGLYYPIADIALLSCIIFLVLRGQGRIYQSTARRVGLLVLGLGLCFFVGSDFFFNVQQNAGTYVEATWLDLGWPLGLMTMGIAACLRRFLPATSQEVIQKRQELLEEQTNLTPMQFVPYALLGLLFVALALDVLAPDNGQRMIRPVLLFATIAVVALVVTRQIYTMWENMRLTQRQAEALISLERANQRVAEQSHQIAEYNAELERGIEHLKDVQANLANGNLKARATLTSGALLPLAGSLNLMGERLSRLGQISTYGQRIMRALSDLSIAFERHAKGIPFNIPESCRDLIEINRLLVALRVRGVTPIQQHNQAAQAFTPVASFSSNGAEPLPQRPPSPHPVTQPLRPRIMSSSYQPHESDPQWASEDDQRRTGMGVVSNSGPLRPAPNKRTD
ncbi:MAG: hypothetical protein JO031_07455 [Ktedonobacteraceae bacterium]|nr:hypothetical protein [Ktedonobacteraceae bacterium]